MLLKSRFLALSAVAQSLALLAPAFGVAQAEDMATFEVTLTGAAFDPVELHVPAQTPFVIRMKNANAAPAEFEAKDMKIEKVVAGNSEIVVRVKALAPGKYLFVDEYQEDVAKGYVIAE
jgi:hypothetical protein